MAKCNHLTSLSFKGLTHDSSKVIRVITTLEKLSAKCHHFHQSKTYDGSLGVISILKSIDEASTHRHHVLHTHAFTQFWLTDSLAAALQVGNRFLIPKFLTTVTTTTRPTTTPCLKKNCAKFFCQNFVKCPPILIIFGRKMAKRLKLCKVYSFSTSPNLRHHTTVLNADVLNCYKIV